MCSVSAGYYPALNTIALLHQGRGRDGRNLGDLRCDLRPLFICVRSLSVLQTFARAVSQSAAVSRTGSASGVCLSACAGLDRLCLRCVRVCVCRIRLQLA